MAGFRNHADTVTTSAHHRHHDKKSITESSPPSTSAPVEPASQIDRSSAIALSIILGLILMAVAWFLYLHFTHKRQDAADLEHTLPFSSDERPAPTHLFRLQPRKTFPEQSSPPPAQFRLQSRKTFPEVSHPVAQSRLQSRKSFADPPPTPKSRSQTTLPRRNSSLSQSQYDKQWWSEVGRRGSATAATRRLSVLEPVLEHDIRSRSCESKKPSKPEASKKNEVGSSRRRSSTHASWEGSRCESVMYDWTRPTDEEVRSKSTGKIFKGVDWNQGSDSVRGRQQERAELVESRDDSVYRMDWALKM
ncbi:hypothetical protein TUN199_03407 [Pyrenophora tritici-repentis]|uniref:Uncharacterized protein n=1 Tax=Pyrenophora tritici-repentis TaxID=45151 RepID=A0A2W1DQ50_9PLEO|nr:hypothetical protein PtrM4_029650 [Pyrenophora tritici-repentis]KAI0586396.1 hypothetical protein Alg215_02030 [Pyrenophora tritici-repentis]KAI0588379.1 hypothetical protein Alg130_03399 [Pyrenophora tritici-repentis]KAI0612395.1 hypothetical protein TUN205_03359 [Pyrenophora tritici-repentis]KAI0624595.1 hypothetical protein TUN199_03407 [Pyrenophora tritici-repentis]